MTDLLNDIYADGCKAKKYRLSDFFNRWWDEYAQHPAEYITPEQYKAVTEIRGSLRGKYLSQILFHLCRLFIF